MVPGPRRLRPGSSNGGTLGIDQEGGGGPGTRVGGQLLDVNPGESGLVQDRGPYVPLQHSVAHGGALALRGLRRHVGGRGKPFHLM